MVTLEEKLELQRLALMIERLAERIGELHDDIQEQSRCIEKLRTDVQPAVELHHQIRTIGAVGKASLYVVGALMALAVGILTLIKR